MRKILLASTALVAVAGVSAASAEVSISGNTAFGYTSWSDDGTDNASEGDNNNKFLSDTDIGASWSTTTDSGLSISVSYDIDANESGATITGDWGNLSWSDGADAQEVGQSDALPVTVALTGTTSADFNGEEQISGGTIAYSTSISGIDFGVGTTNGGNGSLADETAWGVAYSAEVGGGATVSLGYSAADTAADNTSDATTDATSTNLNASVSVGDLSIEAASTTYKTTRNDDNDSATGYTDYKANNFGVTYAISDSLSVAAQTTAVTGDQASATDYKYDATSYGVDYTIATGVALTASFTDYTQSGTNSSAVSGTSTMVRVKVSF